MAFDEQISKVVVSFYDNLGGPVAEMCKKHFQNGDWRSLVSLRTDPRDYECPKTYLRDVSATDLLRKLEGLPTGINLKDEAEKVFYSCEATNYLNNQRLGIWARWFSDGFFGTEADLLLYQNLKNIREIVAEVLGPLPSTLLPSFGKGATYYTKGDKITIPAKMSQRPERTAKMWWAEGLLHETHWGKSLMEAYPSAHTCPLVKGNRFTTVPKDSSKDRGICIEPSLNISYQLPVGKIIRRRLLRFGIDLKNGQRYHKIAARLASLSGLFATIDLSNASDSVCYQVVKLFLPEGWFNLLDDLRSHFTEIDGKWVKLEKFSSMGNGFTFELETLIFFAIAASCASAAGMDWKDTAKNGDLLVYGDDIIVPTSIADSVLTCLRVFGFTPNREKTFTSGGFRESCGGDFFLGEAVRPYYLKEFPNEPHQLISFANGIRRLATPDLESGSWRLHLRSSWNRVLAALPSDIRGIRGPRKLGDLVIEDLPSYWGVHRDDYQCRRILTWSPLAPRKIKLHNFHPATQLACALYGVPSSGATPRNAVSGYRKAWAPLLER